MAKKNSINALGERERSFVLSLGKKNVVVYHIKSGKGVGLSVIHCSLYPKLGGLFPNLEEAIKRAYRIKSFHERQLEILFVEQGEKK